MEIIETNLHFRAMDTRSKTDRVILHHAESSVCSAEDIHRWHKQKGWSGAGYHFLVRKDGSIYRMRPEDKVGAHAYGSNYNSIGICAEGKYMEEEMPVAQKNSIIELVRYLEDKYGIDTIQGHREVCATSCPGDNYPFEEIVNGVHICGDVEKVLNEQLTSISTEAELQELLNEVYGAGLDVDGIVGPKTNAALRKVALRNYCENDLVGFIQRRLIMNGHGVGETGVDCKYGRLTENAVIKFQQEHGLAVDGIVGKNTFNCLFK